MLNRQTNVIALNVVNDTNTVEAKLLQMKALKDQMKALEAISNRANILMRVSKRS